MGIDYKKMFEKENKPNLDGPSSKAKAKAKDNERHTKK
jgi:hypothetical protein